MARTGKIAQLPATIREQVNQRLDDGKTHQSIADWLNDQPSVQAKIKEAFEGRAVTPDNLSEWRTGGGFREWKAQRLARSMFHQINQMPAERLTELQGGLIDRMATLFAAQMLNQMQNTKELQGDAAAIAKMWREFRFGFASLRRYQFTTVALNHRLLNSAVVSQPKLDRSLSDDEQDRKLADLFGFPVGQEVNHFDQTSQTWTGPDADVMNKQHRKLLLQAAQEAGIDPEKTE
jgi:hypothetical protein